MSKQYLISEEELRELLKSTIKIAVDENDPIIEDNIFAFKLSKTPVSKVGKEKEIREIIVEQLKDLNEYFHESGKEQLEEEQIDLFATNLITHLSNLIIPQTLDRDNVKKIIMNKAEKYTFEDVMVIRSDDLNKKIGQICNLAISESKVAQDKLTVKELIGAKELLEKAKVRIDFVIDRHEKPKAISQLQPPGEVIAEISKVFDEMIADVDDEREWVGAERIAITLKKYKEYLIHKCKESK